MKSVILELVHRLFIEFSISLIRAVSYKDFLAPLRQKKTRTLELALSAVSFILWRIHMFVKFRKNSPPPSGSTADPTPWNWLPKSKTLALVAPKKCGKFESTRYLATSRQIHHFLSRSSTGPMFIFGGFGNMNGYGFHGYNVCGIWRYGSYGIFFIYFRLSHKGLNTLMVLHTAKYTGIKGGWQNNS